MFESLAKGWNNLLAIPGAPWIVWGTILLMLLAIAWYVIGKVRGMIFENTPDRHSYLGTFHDLREQGVLKETEFQKLKATLTGQQSPDFEEDKTVSESDTDTLSPESEQTARSDVNRD